MSLLSVGGIWREDRQKAQWSAVLSVLHNCPCTSNGVHCMAIKQLYLCASLTYIENTMPAVDSPLVLISTSLLVSTE